MTDNRRIDIMLENDTISERIKEDARNDVLTVLSTLDDFGFEESAEEKKSFLEFDRELHRLVDDREKECKLSNLACDWYASGRNGGFKAGFRLAMKLFVAGMR